MLLAYGDFCHPLKNVFYSACNDLVGRVQEEEGDAARTRLACVALPGPPNSLADRPWWPARLRTVALGLA
jgi:hypothetical protein